jgi:hypothetical protein
MQANYSALKNTPNSEHILIFLDNSMCNQAISDYLNPDNFYFSKL